MSSVSQLMIFVRYAVSTTIKEELFFCSALDTTTKASDVMKKVNHFFNENEITWKTCVLSALMVSQQCLNPKVDFEHLFKGRLPTLCSYIASFTGKL